MPDEDQNIVKVTEELINALNRLSETIARATKHLEKATGDLAKAITYNLGKDSGPKPFPPEAP